MINRLEICGNIAAGKTTLARAFGAKLGFATVFEDFSNVASLTDFYQNPAKYAFETEITFTLLHYYQLKKLDSSFAVSDFSMINDYAFALTTLTSKEFIVYEKIFDYIMEHIGQPRKAILLEAQIETLLSRISKRGRGNEIPIAAEYLVTLRNNIQQALSDKFSDTEIIIIDTDFVDISAYKANFLSKLLTKTDSY